MQLFAQPSFETTLPSHEPEHLPLSRPCQLAIARVARTKFVYSPNAECRLEVEAGTEAEAEAEDEAEDEVEAEDEAEGEAELAAAQGELARLASNDSWPLQFSCQLAKSTGNAFIFRIFHINNKVPATVGARCGSEGCVCVQCKAAKKRSVRAQTEAHKRQRMAIEVAASGGQTLSQAQLSWQHL